jgi:hypothetical protein
MPAKEVTTLSDQLRMIGLRYISELPSGTASLLMKANHEQGCIEAYDQRGGLIGILPDEKTSSMFRSDLKMLERRDLPGPTGVLAIISNPA